MKTPIDCCSSDSHNKKGIWSGLISGLVPHSFCLLFVVFSIIGATGATALTKKFLLIPHLFPILIIISLLFAILSAAVYLKKTNQLCLAGIKNKQKYLSILLATTVATNLLLILVIFPAATNWSPGIAKAASENLANMTVTVDIPCPGHAPLIIDELKKDLGVQKVNFQFPSTFEINYDSKQTSPEEIRGLEIFQTFKLINS